MREHPTRDALEAFVMGALEADPKLEEHLATCDACTARLAEEARLELALHGVADRVRRRTPRAAPGALPPRERPTLRQRTIGWAKVLLAATLAAGLVLQTIGPGLRSPAREAAQPAPPPIPNVICPDGLQQVACVEEAHRHGLYVEYPAWAGAPPLGGSRTFGAGPDGAPFPVSRREDP